VVELEESIDIPEANAASCQATGELAAFSKTTRKPLSKFYRHHIVKEFSRPIVEAVLTPRLDPYLPGLMGGLTCPDAEFKDIQDKILELMGSLRTAHEHLLEKLDAQCPMPVIQL